jgi:hypothetical protein
METSVPGDSVFGVVSGVVSGDVSGEVSGGVFGVVAFGVPLLD